VRVRENQSSFPRRSFNPGPLQQLGSSSVYIRTVFTRPLASLYTRVCVDNNIKNRIYMTHLCVCEDRSFLCICLSPYLLPLTRWYIYIYIYIIFAHRKGRRRIRLYIGLVVVPLSSALHTVPPPPPPSPPPPPPLPAHRSPRCVHPERGPSDRLTSREHRTRANRAAYPVLPARPRPRRRRQLTGPRIDFPPAHGRFSLSSDPPDGLRARGSVPSPNTYTIVAHISTTAVKHEDKV